MIGRGQHCDLALRGVGIGREHALVRNVAGGWVLELLGPDADGTPRAVRDGEALQVGRYELQFEVR